MGKIKLFLDEDVHFGLATILQKRGFDVVHAQALDRKGRSDVEQLNYANEKERCVMTFNVKDYVLLHNEYVLQAKEHWGIIVSKQLPVGEALRRILNLLQGHSQKTMKNRLLFLPKLDE